MKSICHYGFGLALLASVWAVHAQDVRVEKIDFKTSSGLAVLGELRIPPVTSETNASPPLVLIFPNAGGMDGTGRQYANALNGKGIATIEINPLMEWDQVKNVGMGIAATRFAVEKFGVDRQRVGMMGFSHGAMVSLIASTELWMNRLTRGNPFRFKAFASLYPLCALMSDLHTADYMNWKTMRPVPEGDKNPYKGMFDQLTGGKVLLLAGENEDYEDAPVECTKLQAAMNRNGPPLTHLEVYPNAGHGWDVPVDRTYNHGLLSRKNGQIRHYRHPATFALSLNAVTDFFTKELRAP